MLPQASERLAAGQIPLCPPLQRGTEGDLNLVRFNDLFKAQ